jgi:hypothetical protein
MLVFNDFNVRQNFEEKLDVAFLVRFNQVLEIMAEKNNKQA